MAPFYDKAFSCSYTVSKFSFILILKNYISIVLLQHFSLYMHRLYVIAYIGGLFVLFHLMQWDIW